MVNETSIPITKATGTTAATNTHIDIRSLDLGPDLEQQQTIKWI